MNRPTTFVAVLLVLLAVVAGCSGTTPAATGAASIEGPGSLGITAWARASGQAGGISAAYLTIANGGAADSLVSAASPATEVVEIHRTTTNGGMMGMHPVTGLAIPAGETVTMAPGGTHLMLIGLTSELRPGSTIELVLTFEMAGSVTITAEVRAS